MDTVNKENVQEKKEETFVVPAINPNKVQALAQQDVKFIEINGQKVPLHLYLQSINRHERRRVLAQMKKEQKSKKVKAIRADTTSQSNTPVQLQEILPEEIGEERTLVPFKVG